MFVLKEFLLTHHGRISRIIISYSKSDSPPLSHRKEYENWFNEANKNFCVEMDLMHDSKKIDDFSELLPYLNLRICCWSLFEKNGEQILEVDLE